MKRKPILIIAGALALILFSFLFIRGRYFGKTSQKDVMLFLDKFDADLGNGNTDTLLKYFDGKPNKKQLKKLLGLMGAKTAIDGKSSALFFVNMQSDSADVKNINAEIIEAKVPFVFTDHSHDSRQTVLTFRLRKTSTGFKIIKIDARQFVSDYMAYENHVRYNYNNTATTQNTQQGFNPITLAAFKTAASLRNRYDSVIWFAHVNKRDYFYVVKGKWDEQKITDPKLSPPKMGLINPDLKEIIPPEYDLIHNISGTINGLIEVERGAKRGMFDLDGKNVVPVNYDQILPVTDDSNLAVLRNGDKYFYLGKDMSITEKPDMKVSDFFRKIKNITASIVVDSAFVHDVMEYNSTDDNAAIYIAPSYMVDLNMIHKYHNYKNPLRSQDQYGEAGKAYEISFTGSQNEGSDNWLEASFYSIKNYFLGGRTEFYDRKNIVIIDKKRGTTFSHDLETDYRPENGGSLSGPCDVNSIKIINDSLFEVKAGAAFGSQLYDQTQMIAGGPGYHYLAIKDNKLTEYPDKRVFGFTKYVKMDESYLNGCYVIENPMLRNDDGKIISHITPEMLRFMKNEIFAEYNYKFKDPRWIEVFSDPYDDSGDSDSVHDTAKNSNPNVDGLLTAIDKYNINWINNKLKQVKQPKVLAAK